MRYYFLGFLLICTELIAGQDTIATGMGSSNFQHCYWAISNQCGGDSQYTSIKFKRRKIKEELTLVSVVNDVMNKSLTIQEADSIFNAKELHPYYLKYEKDKYVIERIILNTEYIGYVIIIATEKNTGKMFLGATLKNSFDLYCKSYPYNLINAIRIDVRFFKKYVMKKITCKFQVFDNLALGDAYHMWNELHIHFF